MIRRPLYMQTPILQLEGASPFNLDLSLHRSFTKLYLACTQSAHALISLTWLSRQLVDAINMLIASISITYFVTSTK